MCRRNTKEKICRHQEKAIHPIVLRAVPDEAVQEAITGVAAVVAATGVLPYLLQCLF